jgi:hypothetical protein
LVPGIIAATRKADAAPGVPSAETTDGTAFSNDLSGVAVCTASPLLLAAVLAGLTAWPARAGLIGTQASGSAHLNFVSRWDLSMLPEQEDMGVRAIVHFKEISDLAYIAPEVRGLRTLDRSGSHVRVYRSADLPQPFWSRAGRKKACTVALDVEPERIERAELRVTIWDGGNGTVADYFTLKGRALPVAANGKHRVIYSVLKLDPALLRRGQNRIELLLDTEDHGLEVLLPGRALVVRIKRMDSTTR